MNIWAGVVKYINATWVLVKYGIKQNADLKIKTTEFVFDRENTINDSR